MSGFRILFLHTIFVNMSCQNFLGKQEDGSRFSQLTSYQMGNFTSNPKYRTIYRIGPEK